MASEMENKLKGAAIAGAMAVAGAGNAQAAEVNNDSKVDKIEVVAEVKAPEREAGALDYAHEAAKVNIEYHPEDKAYTITEGNSTVVVTEAELQGKKLEREYEKEHKEKFSNLTEYQIVALSAQQFIQKDVMVATYHTERNSIVFNEVEDIAKFKEEATRRIEEQNPSLSKEEIDKRLDAVIETIQGKGRESVRAHEESHRDDDKAGFYNQTNISPYHRAQIDMMTEVKANMVQAGMALQQFKETGDLSGFNHINCDMTELKKQLSENPNSPNVEKQVAAVIYNNWMKEHNVAGSSYSDQAYKATDANVLDMYQGAAKVSDSPTMDKEYQARVDAMFRDVPGLGDVRNCVNPNFELNSALKGKISNDLGAGKETTSMMNKVTEGAGNVKQATRKIGNFLNVFKKADKDGKRTSKEQSKIDRAVAKTCYEKSGRISSDNKTTVKSSGREQVNVVSSGRSGGYGD